LDIFGEGVDIPAVSHVLFLRPTQSFTVFLQQLGRGLRHIPEKEFLVALDFVGNFRQSYVAPLALRGYTGVEHYRQTRNGTAGELPAACYVSADTDVQRIWDSEVKKIFGSRVDILKSPYQDLRSNLGHSPLIMDFFANPSAHDPYLFLKETKLGGNWLRVKAYMDDLTAFEREIFDTLAEQLLQHLERELSPAKSYKMVVLKSILALGGVEWQIDEIAKLFLQYYLENRECLFDFEELAKAADPTLFPLSKVQSHLIRMPLGKLVNTGGEFFQLDNEKRLFRISEQYCSHWLDPEFREMVADRVEFGLARYFYQKQRRSTVSSDMKGFAVEIPYNTRKGTGFTEQMRNIIASDPSAVEWECQLGGSGYSAKMDIEVQNDQHFIAWTSIRFDDTTRFPARIKAAATALCEEGIQGEFQVVAEKDSLKILRKSQ
jgi:hypothetical protein